MKKTTRQMTAIAAASAILIGASAAAFAHGGGPGYGPRHGMMGNPGSMNKPGNGYMGSGPCAGNGPQQGMMGGPRGMNMPGGGMMRGGHGPQHGMMGPKSMGMPGAGMMGGMDPVANSDQYLTELKTSLGITEDQEEAWNTYSDAITEKANLMQSHRQARQVAGPVDAEQFAAFRSAGQAQMQKVSEASRNLYDVLTPEQQSNAGNLMGFNARHW